MERNGYIQVLYYIRDMLIQYMDETKKTIHFSYFKEIKKPVKPYRTRKNRTK